MWTWDSTEIFFDQTCWTFDGYNGCTPVRKGGSTGRRGPVRKRIREPSDDFIMRRRREEQELVDLIAVILMRGII